MKFGPTLLCETGKFWGREEKPGSKPGFKPGSEPLPGQPLGIWLFQNLLRSSSEREDSSSPVWSRSLSCRSLCLPRQQQRLIPSLALRPELRFTLKGLQVFLVLFWGEKTPNTSHLNVLQTAQSPFLYQGGEIFSFCPSWTSLPWNHPQPGGGRNCKNHKEKKPKKNQTAKTTKNSTHQTHSFLIQSLQSLDSKTSERMETQATFLPREMDSFYLFTLPKGFFNFCFSLLGWVVHLEFRVGLSWTPLCKAVHE